MAAAGGTWKKGKFHPAKGKRRAPRNAEEASRLASLDEVQSSIREKKYSQDDLLALRAQLDEALGESEAVNKRIKEERPRREQGRGHIVRTYGADPRNQYDLRYEIRELDDLTTSNTDSGAVNPAYPQELQPRDRTRTASRQQVEGPGEPVTFEQFANFMTPQLPTGEMGLAHYLGATSRDLWRKMTIPHRMTYRQLLEIIWNEPKTKFSLVQSPAFAYAGQRDDDGWVLWVDGADNPLMVYGQNGFKDYYHEVAL